MDDREIFSLYLQPGESMQWSGRPLTGLMFRKSDAGLIPFSLLWCGFAVFWEYTVSQSGAPVIFPLFGAAFVIVGLYLVAGRFLWDIVVRSKTVYGLTNERALFLSGVFGQSLKSVELKSVSEVTLQINSDGRGTIVFGSIIGAQSLYNSLSWPGYRQVSYPTFERIENPNHVYQLVQNGQRK